MMKILSLFSIFSLLIHLSSQTESNPSGAHKELSNYGFPMGLLPLGVTNYAVNETSGEFWVDLGGACKITLPPDNYLAQYSDKIRGKIVKGKIGELDGIRVRAMFSWWSITGIRMSGDNLVFEVGMLTAKYPSNNFDVTPRCENKKHSDS